MIIDMDTKNDGKFYNCQNYTFYDSSITLPNIGRLSNKDSSTSLTPRRSSPVTQNSFTKSTQQSMNDDDIKKENCLRQDVPGPTETLLESFPPKKQQFHFEQENVEQPLFIPQPPSQSKSRPSRTMYKTISSDIDSDKRNCTHDVLDQNVGKCNIDVFTNEKKEEELINMYKDFLNEKFINNVQFNEKESYTDETDESDFCISSLSENESESEISIETHAKSNSLHNPLYSLPVKEKNGNLNTIKSCNLLNNLVISKAGTNCSDEAIINTYKTGSLPDLRSIDKVNVKKFTHVTKNDSEAESEPGAKLTYKFRPLPPIPTTSGGLYETIDGLSKQSLGSEKKNQKQKEKPKTFKEIATLLTLIPKLKTNSVRSRKQDHKLAEISRYLPDKKLKIFVGTWNMKGTKSLPDSLDDFLLPPESIYLQDIYVIGTQEGTPFRREWQVRLQESFGPSHVLMQASNFGVLQLSIFVRRELLWFCSSVEQDTIATRMGHKIKTKGALAMSFSVFGTSFLFITSHFTSHEGKLQDRLNDYKVICQSLQLPSTDQNKEEQSDVTKRFDRVFWFGDFNFRVKKPRQVVDQMLSKYHKNEELLIKELLKHDQLNDMFQRAKIFHGFTEAPITFMPTYKFDVNSNRYDTSSKQRVPSWTDRVVHKSVPMHHVETICYNSCGSITVSDHRPVYAIFEATIEPYKAGFTVPGGSFNHSVYVEANLRRAAPSGSQSNSHVCTIL